VPSRSAAGFVSFVPSSVVEEIVGFDGEFLELPGHPEDRFDRPISEAVPAAITQPLLASLGRIGSGEKQIVARADDFTESLGYHAKTLMIGVGFACFNEGTKVSCYLARRHFIRPVCSGAM